MDDDSRKGVREGKGSGRPMTRARKVIVTADALPSTNEKRRIRRKTPQKLALSIKHLRTSSANVKPLLATAVSHTPGRHLSCQVPRQRQKRGREREGERGKKKKVHSLTRVCPTKRHSSNTTHKRIPCQSSCSQLKWGARCWECQWVCLSQWVSMLCFPCCGL